MQLADIIAVAAMVGARVSALVVFAPMLSSTAISWRVKAAFCLAVTAVLAPLERVPASHAGGWAGAVAGEMLVGLLLGFMANLVFEAAAVAGQILGFQVGLSLVNVIDPQSQVDSPVLSIFHQMLVMLIFLQLDVHHWLLRGMAKSFLYVPAGTVPLTAATAEGLAHAVGAVWLAALQIAAPALAATMLADIVIGLLGKASPQLPLLFVAIPVKTALGLLLMGAALIYWPAIFERQFTAAVGFSERLLRLGS
jgi:flagellar biosynthetic protein FliR